MVRLIVIHVPWRAIYEDLYLFMRIVYEFMIHLKVKILWLLCNCGIVVRSFFPTLTHDYVWYVYDYDRIIVLNERLFS